MSIQSIRILNPWFLEQDNSGRPAAGYKVYTLEAGSVSTLIDTYSDRNLLVKNTNPIILNEHGECVIFTDLPYVKLVFTSPTGDLTGPIWTQDYVAGANQNDLSNVGIASGTVNNTYIVNTVPTYSSIPDGFSLVMVPDISNLDTLITKTFTGTGINDAYFSGPYIGTTPSTFQVQIDGVGSPNTFKWRKDSGAWTTGVAMTGSYQGLQEGVSVKFSSIVGHTLNDLWTQTVRPPAYLNFCGLGAKLIYKSVDGELKALSGGDIIAGIPAHMDYSASEDCWILLNPTQPVVSAQVPGRSRREVTSTYSVDVDEDWGNEVSCKGNFTVTLPPCSEAAGRFYYIVNAGTDGIQVDVAGGTDLIITPEFPAGVGSILLHPDSRTSAQFVTNGVDWHIVTQTQQVRFGSMQIFYSSGNWTAWPTSTWARVLLIAPGGGGGAALSPTGAGSGGGGGSIVLANVYILGASPVAITIGSPGYGGSGGLQGGDAGDASFGALLTAKGGKGGLAGAGTPGAGGIATLYDVEIDGICLDGFPGVAGGAGAAPQNGGAGGDAGGRRGQGGAGGTSGNGGVGGNYGAGGGGGHEGTVTSYSGGAGGPGLCIVWW